MMKYNVIGYILTIATFGYVNGYSRPGRPLGWKQSPAGNLPGKNNLENKYFYQVRKFMSKIS